MQQPLLLLALLGALGSSACAAGGDPSPGSTHRPADPARSPESAGAPSVEARDVAILVLEQTPSSLTVISSARRPRSSFGPAASWNGTGTATHAWKLVGKHGETIAAGDIVARGSIEAPPNEKAGAPGAIVAKDTTSFTVKVPQPDAGERIEIAPIAGGDLVARWP